MANIIQGLGMRRILRGGGGQAVSPDPFVIQERIE